MPKKRSLLSKAVIWFVLTAFALNPAIPVRSYAQGVPTILNLPAPGTLITSSPSFVPVMLRGIKIDPNNPLRFEFVIDKGNSSLKEEQLKIETNKLIKYFLVSLAVPEKDLWVNLSPYESDRIVPEKLGQTEMGRDLLAQDYVLKQLTASLVYPENALGKTFWDKVHSKAYELYGTTKVPVKTFNKVWIVPDKVKIYENGDVAFLVQSRLKVMLEEDYLALEKNAPNMQNGPNQFVAEDVRGANALSSKIVKEIIIPEIEKDVNEGENFAQLRQIVNSLMLALWFKRALRNNLLNQVYSNKEQIGGVEGEDQDIKQKIYDQYIEAYKQGVYNYIREDYDPRTQEVIPRKYFSGGFEATDVQIDHALLADATAEIERMDASSVVLAQIDLGFVGGGNNGTGDAGTEVLVKALQPIPLASVGTSQNNGGGTAAGLLPEDLERYRPIFDSIDDDADLRLAIEFLKKVSPNFAGVIVSEVESRGIPIQMTGAAQFSNAEKSLYSILHRDHAFASRVNIRKGATVLELIHELTHSVPINRLPPPLKNTRNITIDTSLPEAQIGDALIQIGYLEEAVSLASEIHLAEDLARNGIALDFDSTAPGARMAYEEGGIEGLAQAVPDIFPYYRKQFYEMAALYAPQMKKPIGQLLNIPWSDKLAEFGIEATQRFGKTELVISPLQAVDTAREILASHSPEELMAAAKTKLTELTANWEKRQGAKLDQDVTPDTLKDLEFTPLPKQNPADSSDIFRTESELTVARVKVVGNFLHFLEQLDEANEKNIAENYDDVITAARHLDGDQAALLWIRLYAAAKTNVQKKPALMKNLGLALIDAGYLDQGQYALQAYIDVTGKGLSVDNLAKLLQELIQHKQIALADRIHQSIMSQIGSLENEYHQKLIENYEMFFGEFQPQGRQEMDVFFEQQKGRYVSLHMCQEKVLELSRRGLFVFKSGRDPLQVLKISEQRYLEELTSLYTTAAILAKTARETEKIDPSFGKRLDRSSSNIFDLAAAGAQEQVKLRIQSWEEFNGVKYHGDLQAFIKEVEQAPNATVNYDFQENITNELNNLLRALASIEEFLPKTIALLRAFPKITVKLALYQTIARHITDKTPAVMVDTFINEWEKDLHSLVQSERDSFFMDKSRSGSPSDLINALGGWIASQALYAERQMGLNYDAERIIRDFASKLKFISFTPSTTTLQLLSMIKNHAEKSLDAHRELVREIRSADPLTQILLLRILISSLPRNVAIEYLKECWNFIREAFRSYAQVSGVPVPVLRDMEPGDYRQSALFQSQQAGMAEMLLNHDNNTLKERGRQLLLALDEGTALRITPQHSGSATSGFLNHRDRLKSMLVQEDFIPALFKCQKLVEAVEQDPGNTRIYVAELKRILPTISVDFMTTDFRLFEINTVLWLQLSEFMAQNGELESAEEILRETQRAIHQAKKEFQERLAFLTAMDRDTQWLRGIAFGLTDYLSAGINEMDTLVQHIESRQAILFARFRYDVDEKAALHALETTITALSDDVRQRRKRFDVRSMVGAAAVLEKNFHLQGQAEKIYSLAIDQLALLRGEGSILRENSGIVFEAIDQGQLPTVVKDSLLAKAVHVLVPPEGKRNWGQMLETIPGLGELVNKVLENNIYPQTEKEILAILIEMTTGIQSVDEAKVKLRAITAVCKKILTTHPEITVHNNFGALVALDDDSLYRQSLAFLHKSQWHQYQADGGRVVTVESIRAGTIALDEATETIMRLIDDAFGSGNRSALISALALLNEVMDREINRSLAQDNSSMTLDRLRGITSFGTLFQRVEVYLYANRGLNEFEQLMCNALLNGNNKKSAQAKYPIYKELIANPRVYRSLQRQAFDGLISEGKISAYAESFLNNDVLAKQAIGEDRFYRWVKRILDVNGDAMVEDILLAYLFQNPADETLFFQRLEQMVSRSNIRKQLEEDTTFQSRVRELADLARETATFDRDKRATAYQEGFNRLAQDYGLWVPDLVDEIDLLLAYQVRFSWFRNFEAWIEDIRNWFFYELFDVSGKYDEDKGVDITALEHKLLKIAPNIKLSSSQRRYLEQYLRDKKTISISSLQQYLGVTFDARQETELKYLLEAVDYTSDSHIVVEFMGWHKLDDAQKTRLDVFLDQVRSDYNQRMLQVEQQTVEVPQVFENSPPFVRHALVAFFKQLPMGEREAILADFTTQGLTEEQAFKKFCEVTGNEKLGQFFSLRRDLIPDRFREELESLQENVEPSSFEEVRGTLERNLGKRVDEIFASIEPRVLKAGTIGEVYEVKMLAGTRGVVKVITPSKRRVIEKNLARLKAVAQDLEKNKTRFGLGINFLELYAEFERSIKEQIDLRNEFNNAQAIQETLSGSGISIPRFFPEYTTENMLVQSFVEGANPLAISLASQKAVVEKIGEMFFRQVLLDGIYHDDLHPGNIRVAESGSLGITLLDFGVIGRLSVDERKVIVPLLLAIRSGNVSQILTYLDKLGKRTASYDDVGLRAGVQRIIKGGGTISIMVSNLFSESGTHGLQIAPAYLQLLQGVLKFEGTAHRLNPDYSLEDQLKAFVLREKLVGIGDLLRGAFGKLMPFTRQAGDGDAALLSSGEPSVVKPFQKGGIDLTTNNFDFEIQNEKQLPFPAIGIENINVGDFKINRILILNLELFPMPIQMILPEFLGFNPHLKETTELDEAAFLSK